MLFEVICWIVFLGCVGVLIFVVKDVMKSVRRIPKKHHKTLDEILGYSNKRRIHGQKQTK